MDRDEWKTTVRRMVGRLIQATDEYAMAREAVKRAEVDLGARRMDLEEFLLAEPIPAPPSEGER